MNRRLVSEVMPLYVAKDMENAFIQNPVGWQASVYEAVYNSGKPLSVLREVREFILQNDAYGYKLLLKVEAQIREEENGPL